MTLLYTLYQPYLPLHTYGQLRCWDRRSYHPKDGQLRWGPGTEGPLWLAVWLGWCCVPYCVPYYGGTINVQYGANVYSTRVMVQISLCCWFHSMGCTHNICVCNHQYVYRVFVYSSGWTVVPCDGVSVVVVPFFYGWLVIGLLRSTYHGLGAATLLPAEGWPWVPWTEGP